MAEQSTIEWTDATWNPVTGCDIVSPGCSNCYAMRLAGTRLKNIPSRKGLTKPSKAGPVWNGEIRLNHEWLTQPLTWKRPRMIFVCAHGDLFHEKVPDDFLDKVFAVMALAPQHTFQVLTKRPERMREYMNERWQPSRAQRLQIGDSVLEIPAEASGATRETQIREACEPFLEKLGLVDTDKDELWTEDGNCKAMLWPWPLPNVWLGVSAERQKEADERIPHLLATPAAIRFLSAEPLLGPIDLTRLHDKVGIGGLHNVNALTGSWYTSPAEIAELRQRGMAAALDERGPCALDWIIAGGESGQGSRPMHPDWARSLRDQCAAAGVPFFFKQWGNWTPGENVDRMGTLTGAWSFGEGSEQTWRYSSVSQRVSEEMHRDDAPDLWQVGKKAAGRLLDGIEHNGMPAIREVPFQ